MKRHILMVVLQLAASGADAYYTNRNMHEYGFQERNPITAPFVTSTPKLITYFSVTTAIKIAAPEILRRHGHNKAAGYVAGFSIADNSIAAATSAF